MRVPRASRYWKPGDRCPVTTCPSPGQVGLDHRAKCHVCGKRVYITARCKFAPHKGLRG